MIILIGLLFLGFPMMIPLLGASIFMIVTFLEGVDSTIIIQQLIGGVSSFVLLAIPMFIFAADIMSTGQTANRLVDFVKSFIGHLHGGLAITTVGACTIFGAISGSTQATIAAIGRPMREKMLEAGYDDSETMGMIINASDIAVLIPPSSVMIMYGVVTGTSVGQLFASGIGPGILTAILFSVYCYFSAKRNRVPVEPKATMKDKLVATKNALLAFGFPVIVLGGIFTGIFSPTEAAATSVLYSAIIELFVYKSIKLKDLPRIALSTGIVTGVVFILVAAGSAFSWTISYARIPQLITSALLGDSPSPMRILIIINIVYFIACMFVDSLVAITVITPIFFPIAIAAGIDPVFLGTVITLQAAIGSATPPFGCDIFTAVAVFDRPYLQVIRRTPPYIVILLVVAMLLLIFPDIALFLRDIAFGS